MEIERLVTKNSHATKATHEAWSAIVIGGMKKDKGMALGCQDELRQLMAEQKPFRDALKTTLSRTKNPGPALKALGRN